MEVRRKTRGVMRHAAAFAGGLMAGTAVWAQGTALPTSMSGVWAVPANRNITNQWSVKLERQEAGGAVAGKLTWWGLTCGADGEPFTGSFDGRKLQLRSMLRENVNTRQPKGNCGAMVADLMQGADGAFEGTAYSEVNPSAVVNVTLKP
jgi:hypothetical protein